MNKESYLKELDKYLKRLPRKDYESAVSYFREYFEEAGEENEQQVMMDLGTPKEAAAEVLQNLLEESSKELQHGRRSGHIGSNIRLAILAVFAAPVALPLAFTAIAMIAVLVLMMFVAVLCIFVFSLSFFCLGGKLFLRGLVAFAASAPGALVLCGLGIFAAGCGILTVLLAVYLTKWLSAGITMISRKMIEKRRK